MLDSHTSTTTTLVSPQRQQAPPCASNSLRLFPSPSTTATVANSTLALQASPLATVENSQGLSSTADRKRRHSRDFPQLGPGKPPRRPGHISHKSASAIPTLSTINILPYTPKVGSPLVASPGSPSSARTSASSRRPSIASAKSWVGRPSTMATAPHEQLHVNNAADLLRQAMLTNSGVAHVRYVFSLPLFRSRHTCFQAVTWGLCLTRLSPVASGRTSLPSLAITRRVIAMIA